MSTATEYETSSVLVTDILTVDQICSKGLNETRIVPMLEVLVLTHVVTIFNSDLFNTWRFTYCRIADEQANGRQPTAATQNAGHGGGGNRAAAVAGAGGYNSSEFVDYWSDRIQPLNSVFCVLAYTVRLFNADIFCFPWSSIAQAFPNFQHFSFMDSLLHHPMIFLTTSIATQQLF